MRDENIIDQVEDIWDSYTEDGVPRWVPGVSVIRIGQRRGQVSTSRNRGPRTVAFIEARRNWIIEQCRIGTSVEQMSCRLTRGGVVMTPRAIKNEIDSMKKAGRLVEDNRPRRRTVRDKVERKAPALAPAKPTATSTTPSNGWISTLRAIRERDGSAEANAFVRELIGEVIEARKAVEREVVEKEIEERFGGVLDRLTR